MTNREPPPLVTFLVFAYNQEHYVREAVLAAFAQDYADLEIILSDDGSSDQTFEVMQEMAAAYRGNHRVVLNKNPQNLGIGAHVNVLGAMASGELVVFSAGDDVSAPERTRKLCDEWLSRGKRTACMYSDVVPVDSDGQVVEAWRETVYPGPHTLERHAAGDIRVLGAATAYTRDIFSAFAPMAQNVMHEDRVLPTRALLLGGEIIYHPQPLVRYRTEGGVSRSQPIGRKEYLRALVKHETRAMYDAVQRLVDVLSSGMPRNKIVWPCIQQIVDHQAFIAMGSSNPTRYEMALLRAVRGGARAWPVFKLYLKMRFIGK